MFSKSFQREKNVTYKGMKTRKAPDLSTAVMDAKRQWNNIFKILRENDFQFRIQYSAKLSIRYQGRSKTFVDTEGLREFTSHILFLRKSFEDVLQ